MVAQAELQEHVIHWMEPANALQMLIQDLHVMVNTLNLYKLFCLRDKRISNFKQKFISIMYMSLHLATDVKMISTFSIHFHSLLVFQCTTDGDCNGHGTCNTPLSVGKEIRMYKKHKRPAYFFELSNMCCWSVIQYKKMRKQMLCDFFYFYSIFGT